MKAKIFENFIQIPTLFIYLCFAVNQSYGRQSDGQLYNKRENQEPTGKEITSLTVQFYGQCALECNRDPRCHTFGLYDNVNSCRLYSCTDAQHLTESLGTTSYITADVQCLAGYTQGPCGHCYQYIPTAMSWQQARDHCAASTPGAYLAEIESEEENQHVWSLIGDLAWLGSRTVSGSWVWAHSSQSVDTGYTSWGTNQPDGDGKCMAIIPSSTWNDNVCRGGRHVVCEYG